MPSRQHSSGEIDDEGKFIVNFVFHTTHLILFAISWAKSDIWTMKTRIKCIIAIIGYVVCIFNATHSALSHIHIHSSYTNKHTARDRQIFNSESSALVCWSALKIQKSWSWIKDGVQFGAVEAISFDMIWPFQLNAHAMYRRFNEPTKAYIHNRWTTHRYAEKKKYEEKYKKKFYSVAFYHSFNFSVCNRSLP